jgi:hypothetical protein
MNEISESLIELCISNKFEKIKKSKKDTALMIACSHGNRSLLTHLVNKYMYSAEQIMANDNTLLKMAFSSGSREVMMDLVFTFSIPYDVAMLVYVCNACNLYAVECFLEIYNVPTRDALRISQECINPNIKRYLVDRFS